MAIHRDKQAEIIEKHLRASLWRAEYEASHIFECDCGGPTVVREVQHEIERNHYGKHEQDMSNHFKNRMRAAFSSACEALELEELLSEWFTEFGSEK